VPVPSSKISGFRGSTAFRVALDLVRVTLDLQSANVPEIAGDLTAVGAAIAKRNIPAVVAAVETLVAAAKKVVTDPKALADLETLAADLGIARG
jgi:uncharacterized protein YhdP